MTDKNRPQGKQSDQQPDQKGSAVQPNPGVGQKQPDNKGKSDKQGNPAGQGYDGDDDVKPAGRETPG